MPKFFFSLFLFIATQPSCTRTFRYYEGHVYSQRNQKPMSNLNVRLQSLEKHETRTSSTGYFKIPAKPGIVEKIYLFRDEKLLDSINPILEHAGEAYEFRFVDGRQDTFFIAERQ